jgi:Ca2+:H+ antiporter
MAPTDPTDRTPLLENGGENVEDPEARQPFARRAVALLKGEGEPTWAQSYKYFWFGAWLNLFLIFVPLSFIAHHLNWDAALRFSFSFIAICPLAKVCIFGDVWGAVSLICRCSFWETPQIRCR